MMEQREPVLVVVRNDRMTEVPLSALVPDISAEGERRGPSAIVRTVQELLRKVWAG